MFSSRNKLKIQDNNFLKLHFDAGLVTMCVSSVLLCDVNTIMYW